MTDEEMVELELLLTDLKRYKHPYIKNKVKRLDEIFQPMLDKYKKRIEKNEKNKRYAFNDFNPVVKCQQVQSVLKQLPGYYQDASLAASRSEGEMQDILHKLELEELTDDEILQAGKRLKEVRKTRRLANDFVSLAEPLKKFLDGHPQFIKKFSQLTGDVMAKERKLSNRIYTPRVPTAIEKAFEKAKSNEKEVVSLEIDSRKKEATVAAP
jgi:hypothetical protein